MKALRKLALLTLVAGAILPATLHAQSDDSGEAKKPKKEKSEKKKKNKDGKKKDKDNSEKPKAEKSDEPKTEKAEKQKPAEPAEPAVVGAAMPDETGAKGGIVEKAESSVADSNWCTWLQNKPGLLYDNDQNPWFQSFRIGGRFHYQAVYLEGTDVNGRDFNDKYDEYRRLRLETKTKFLRYLTAEVNINLVDDERFREGLFTDLEWGYDRFDEASLEFDIGEAFGDGWLDGIKLKYGRMKLKMTEEAHQSSDDTYTIERSAISEKVGGDASRPTGVTLELDKGDWELVLGMFSGEDDADFLGAWNDGQFYYGCLRWQATEEFKLLVDTTLNDQSGVDDSLGYGWATALSAIYETKRWGILGEIICGDNGGDNGLIARRQGDFHGYVVMPWVWIIEDKLQAVVQYQYASSSEPQGLQMPVRYVRAGHEDPAVDVDNGRGHQINSIYGGLNYHFCRDRLKVMGGVQYDDLTTRRSDVKALSYQIAFRTAF